MTDRPTVERLDEAAVEDVVDLLAANDLPHNDLAQGPARFFGIVEDDALVAVGGLEPHGTDGLLRSVAVAESRRGHGLGTQICEAIEHVARDGDIRSLYLLTTTAAGFFRELGYAELERAAAPPPIEASREFAKVCPDGAVLMAKALT
jgi:amino-acid N-acetyltransferase